MKIPSIALLAMSVPGCLGAANLSNAPLAVYYSFDTSPPAALFTEMQAELGRILAPADLHVAWRTIDAPRSGEDFRGIAVLRFHGSCSFGQDSAGSGYATNPAGKSLASTDLTGGHVLPFGAVDCDQLRRFIAPAVKSLSVENKNAALGRAMARVGAHEIYHILTGSGTHASQGIARASHSRAELIAPTFAFAKMETNWLRAWADKQADRPTVAAVESAETQSDAESAPEPVALAGR
jgi:hypothetical protein